ncbi:hypothetical protein BJP50_16210 [Paenibacillus odorifer]|nr:hypothetical protein BJP50_16210 [Paenibacillus odorifer]
MENSIIKKLNELLNREIQDTVDADLRNQGLDSIKTIELIVNLEVEFDIEFDDKDLVIDNFLSISKICSLLTGKYGVQQC